MSLLKLINNDRFPPEASLRTGPPGCPGYSYATAPSLLPDQRTSELQSASKPSLLLVPTTPNHPFAVAANASASQCIAAENLLHFEQLCSSLRSCSRCYIPRGLH